MRRLSLVLAVWLALVGAAHAETSVAEISTNSASGNDNNAVPVPPTTTNGDLLIFCFETDSGAVASLGAAWTMLDSTTNTIWAGCAKRTASSEPASYSPTW